MPRHTGSTVSPEDSAHLHTACRHHHLDWEPGSTEPWIIDAVAALLVASGQRRALELGGYKGACARVLARTLSLMGGGHLTTVEYDPALYPILIERLQVPDLQNVRVEAVHAEAVAFVQSLPERSVGFVWVDDSHDTPHVVQEMETLIPKMVDGGIICFHDVYGHYDLRQVVQAYGGYCLDLPRVSSSGGLGILQVQPETRSRHVWVANKQDPRRPDEVTLASLSPYGMRDGEGKEHLHWAPSPEPSLPMAG